MFTGLDLSFLGQSLSQRGPEELGVSLKGSIAAQVVAFQYGAGVPG